MADEKALKLDSTTKLQSNVGASDTLVIGAGIKSSSGSIAIAPATNSINAVNLTTSTGVAIVVVHTSNGWLGVGVGDGAIPTDRFTANSNTARAVAAGGVLHFVGPNASSSACYGSSFGGAIRFVGRRADGTLATKTTLVSSDVITQVSAEGWDGSAYVGPGANINMVASETWSGTARGTYITFETTPSASTTIAERVRITQAGLVGIGTNAPVYKLTASNNISAPRSFAAGGTLHTISADGATNVTLLDAYGAAPIIAFRATGGTNAAPTAMGNGAQLSGMYAWGWGATAYSSNSRAGIEFVTNQAWTDAAQGANTVIYATAANTTTILTTATFSVGSLNMHSNKIIYVGEPAASGDAATKNYVDTTTAGIGSDATAVRRGSITTEDSRSLVPSGMSAVGKKGVMFHFGSVNANGLAHWADCITLNTYPDSSGGGVNQILCHKNDGTLYHRFGAYGAETWTWLRKVWDDGNDGAGSGLDADLLDGQQGSYYQAAVAGTTAHILQYNGSAWTSTALSALDSSANITISPTTGNNQRSVALRGQTASSAATSGGDLYLQGGSSLTTGIGGSAYLAGGNSSGTGSGGSVYIRGGASTSGTRGSLYLGDLYTSTSYFGAGTNGTRFTLSTNTLEPIGSGNIVANQIKTTGTAVSISTTAPAAAYILQASSTTAAAWVSLSQLDASANIMVRPDFGDNQRTMTIQGQTANGSNITGGAANFNGGNATGSGTGGWVGINGGASSTGVGGSITIRGGNTSGTKGDIWIGDTYTRFVWTGSNVNGIQYNCSTQIMEPIGTATLVASAVKTTGTAVSISTTAPSSGQALVASSATAAAWTTITGLPSGTAGQIIQHNGTSWVTVSTNSAPSMYSGAHVYLGPAAGDSQRAIVIQGQGASSASTSGGTAQLLGGVSTGTVEGGYVLIQGGASGTGGTGGRVYIRGGVASGGTTGTLYIGDTSTFAVTLGPWAGPAVRYTASTATLEPISTGKIVATGLKNSATTVDTTASGSPVAAQILQASSSTAASWVSLNNLDASANVIISPANGDNSRGVGVYAQSALSATIPGGSITVQGGTGATSGGGGHAWFQGGSTATGTGGTVTLRGGTTSGAGTGGSVYIRGGGTTGGTSGSIFIGDTTTVNVDFGSGANYIRYAVSTATLAPGGTGKIVSTGLKSATTTVDVSAATAPSNGQVLTATSSTTATWQTPVSLPAGTTAHVLQYNGSAWTSTSLGSLVDGGATITISPVNGDSQRTLLIRGQTASAANTAGGSSGVYGGSGTGSGAGGEINLSGGLSAGSGTGGNVVIFGGSSSSGQGGSTLIRGGSGGSAAGNIVLADMNTVYVYIGGNSVGTAKIRYTASNFTLEPVNTGVLVANSLRSASTDVVTTATTPAVASILQATSTTAASWVALSALDASANVKISPASGDNLRELTLQAQTASSAATNGGALLLRGGEALTTGTGGVAYLVGGGSGAGGTGGAVIIRGGASTTHGNIFIGDAYTTYAYFGAGTNGVRFTLGSNTLEPIGTGVLRTNYLAQTTTIAASATVACVSGDTGATTTFRGMNSVTATVSGGHFIVQGGSTTGSGSGGNCQLIGGNTATGTGGPVVVHGGTASGAGTGGSAYIRGGGTTGGSLGSVVIGDSNTTNVTIGGGANYLQYSTVTLILTPIGTAKIQATGLKYSSGTIDTTAASTPSNGQALVATSATTATWQTLSYQPSDATLTALAGLTTSANNLILCTGADTFSVGQLTDAYVAAANKDGVAGTASLRTLGTGAQQAAAGNHTHSYQPLDATLTALAGLTTSANTLILNTGADTFSVGALTDAYVATANKDGVAGTASLRTLGTGAQQACAGNDSRLSNSRTPTAHASTHQNGGSDEIATATAAANSIPKTGATSTLAIGWIPTGSTSTTVCIGDDARLSNARTPTAHASTHNAGGSDALAIDAAAGTGSLRTLSNTATSACAGNDSRLSDDRTASGLRSATTVVSVSAATAPTSGQVLTATSATTATWQTISGTLPAGTNGHILQYRSGAWASTATSGLYAPTDITISPESTSSAGSSLYLKGATSTAASGGHIYVQGGNAAAGDNAPGNVYVLPGTGGSAFGNIYLGSAATTNAVVLGASADANRLLYNSTYGLYAPTATGYVVANAIKTTATGSTGPGVVISTTAPSANQVLMASSATAAAWTTISYQSSDATLTALAGLTTSANNLILCTGADTFSVGQLTDAYVAAANKDGAAATASLRTLGTTSASAAAGNHQHMTGSSLTIGTSISSSISGDGNVGVGPYAFQNLTSGQHNVGVGYNTLQQTTTTSFNTAVGSYAGGSIKGTSNVAVGRYALTGHSTNNTAINCVAVGQESLYSETSGSYNTAVGFGSGYALTSGAENTAVGHKALYSCTTTNWNVAIGEYAAYYVTTGSNVAIGTSALYGAAGMTAGENIGIGANAGSGIRGDMARCVFVGHNSGYNAGATGCWGNTGVGWHTFRYGFSNAGGATTGAYNTAVGSEALSYPAGGTTTLSGSNNTAVGVGSLAYLTSGCYNTAVGMHAGLYSTTGVNNVFVGYRAGVTAAGADSQGNTVVGVRAAEVMSSGYYNTCLGYVSGVALTSGAYNTLAGHLAAPVLTTGTYNTCLGQQSGVYLTTGHRNVCIGYMAGNTLATGSDNVVIGNSAGIAAGTSECIAIGKDALVGNAQAGNIQIGAGSNSDYNGGTNKYLRVGAGNVAGGYICRATTWEGYSDRRLKENIQDLQANEGLQLVEALRPVSYLWKSPEGVSEENKALRKPYFGLVAQEVKEAMDGVGIGRHGTYDDNDAAGWSLNYDSLTAPLIKAVQELSAMVKALQAEVAELKAKQG